MMSQQQQIVKQSSSVQQSSSSVSMQQTKVQQVQQTQQQTVREVRQGVQMVQGPTQLVPLGLPAGASPPVFEQIFRNARFAQGGDALFEGKVQGDPKPTVTWTRRGQQIASGPKYQVTHDPISGIVTLLISAIGPGDEGEYTCTAANQFGEAICTVFIQPEAAYMMQQQRQQQQQQSIQSKQVTMSQQQQSFSQQQQIKSHMEAFRVDTFEYRLLHEAEFRQSVTMINSTQLGLPTQGAPQAPQIQQKPRATKVAQGGDATFSVGIVSNPAPQVVWFKNGERIQTSEKHQMVMSSGQVNLVVKRVNSSDSGHYTMLAENASGCTVSSAQLACVDQVVNGHVPEVIRPERAEPMDVDDSGDESSKSMEPKFINVPGDREVQEGKLVRFDCRVTGRPYPEVLWMLNGAPIIDDSQHKILVNEQGNHSLMITEASVKDNGVITCIAKNKTGQTNFESQLRVLERQQVVAPKFVERFQQGQAKEGETVVLQARAVGTPTPVLSWQKDGVGIQSCPAIQITSEGGASSIQILSATGNDAGWYQCTAQNTAGSTATRARLHVQVERTIPVPPPKPQFPKPSKVIEPEKPAEAEIIYLRHVEREHQQVRGPDDEQPTEAPQFTHPLRDIEIMEGTRAHFEAKVTPVGDATMKVEWLLDGQPLAASSRATVTYRFGYVALDILNVIKADVGVYTCRIANAMGQAETSANLRVNERPLIESGTQHPEAMEQISYLEDSSRYQRSTSVEEHALIKPQFVRPLVNLGDVLEGKYAHFEAQLHPVSDPFMKIEWFKDGKHITASSRINVIYNFGYVALNIMHLRQEDSGVYTVKATNKAGECTCQGSVKVLPIGTVTGDLGIPEQAQYIKSVEEMEAYRLQMQQKSAVEVTESSVAPVFKSNLKDTKAREGGYAHFEARLEPIGDPSLKVEWLKDGRTIEASSRITTFFNFGYVALTIKALIQQDAGNYTCRAYNSKGEVKVSCNLIILSKTDEEMETQFEDTVLKMQFLEDSTKMQTTEQTETTVSTMPPKFLGPIKGTNKIVEGQKAHFEVKLEPQSDITMQVEWYFNGHVIMSASRIRFYNDFGYVAMDISDVRSSDSGTYTVIARNSLGEVQLSTTMVVEVRSTIDYTSMHDIAVGKYERGHHEPQREVEEVAKTKPEFTQVLHDLKPIQEGKNIHLEARLEPMGDPTMKVEWFFNGQPITIGSRFKTYFDFGYVALDVVGAYSKDSGEYTCRATNFLGSTHTSSCVRVVSSGDIYTESMHDGAVEQIQVLESSRNKGIMQEESEINQPPTFTKSLRNIETIEGTNIHLEARLQPLGDPTMKTEWYFNDQPLKVGHRFRPAYDFDYVALDLLSVYPADSGIYTCKATNKLGQAVASASVRVVAKKDLVFDSEHPESLQKLQYLDDSSRYQRRETMEEVTVKIKPKFLTKLKDNTHQEGANAHFEAKIEPITDPNLRVEWYKDGKPLAIGSRFRQIHDFGYVALDIRSLVAEDTGVYTCVATNLLGKDEITATLNCLQGSSIIMDTQNQTLSLQQLQMLEDKSKYSRSEHIDETTQQTPVFTSSLKNLEIIEGQRAHFEVRLIPTSDPTMKIEWFHNDQRVKSGSRFTEYNDFGFVALDIMYAYAEDSGTYTCIATNALGQAMTSCTLTCHTKESILLDTMNQEAMSKISRLELTKSSHTTSSEETTMQAPVFTTPMKDQQLLENAPLHFESRLIPVGDADLRVEWFKNGVPIQQANRISTMHDFGYVALDMKYVNPEDSGTYTCRATNKLGQAVTSASLVVSSKESLLLDSQHSEALEKLRYLEDSSRFTRTTTEETVITTAPRFVVQLSGLTQLWEGQSAHVECRLEPYPDPTMKVEWFHNGKPFQVGHRFRTMYDFGFCAMDILSAVEEDSGTYEVKATNRCGTSTSSITISVRAKGDFIIDSQHPEAMAKIARLEQKQKSRLDDDSLVIEKPNFGRPLRNLVQVEGQAIHLEATLTPVNDPTMKVEWYFNGIPIPSGHRFRTTYDFGFVALDILYAYPEDSGTYMCKATNGSGQAITSCSIRVEATESMMTGTMDEARLRRIKELEKDGRRLEDMPEQSFKKPVFTSALTNVEGVAEGERVHLECRLEPVNDPNLRVDWYVNGVEIKAGHRFRTTHDFGYVALDILYAYSEDSGTYLCKATNKLGEAVNSCSVNVTARRSIYMDSVHPTGWEKIQNLEQRSRYEKLEVADLPNIAPRFTSELRGLTTLGEGQRAHLEGRIEPIHDPSMRVEWYVNGKILQSAARFHTTFDFGYVALDMTSLYAEDSGEYTCRAFNSMGEAISKMSITVEGSGNIIYESARPEGLDKIRELEDSAKFSRQVSVDQRTFQRPVFTQPLQNLDNLVEGETAHFECRLIPVGDPNLKVEWYRNETQIETSSRINRTHDFGYVALDIIGVRPDDEGIYMCRAHNDLGEAVTTASIKIKSHASIQFESQHPEGMKKIQALEDRKPQGLGADDDKVFDKPVFTSTLIGPSTLMEGQRAHFECRVVPVGDPTMRFEWFCNGVALKMGSRFQTSNDFGFVTLDILQTIPEDSGIYMCKAFNSSGEAISSCNTKILAKDSIIGDAVHKEGWETIRQREAQWNRVPQTPTSPEALEPPMFTKQLESFDRLQENEVVRLEAQVQPSHDPHLSIEWYKNGVQLATGTRIRSTFDFGHVTLDISGLRGDDSGIYSCKAVNRVGEAVSTCTLKVFDKDWLIGDSVRPEALAKLARLEEGKTATRSDTEKVYEAPVFISHLNNVECQESENAHFECRVEPSKDPTMKIEWFINGAPLPAAARYSSTYDFGFVALDCTHCYAEDSGIYMVRATNSKGSASTTGTLKCFSKANLYFDTTHPQGKAGLERVEEAERAFWSKYQRQASEREMTYPKPFFVRPLQTNFSVVENQALHMEANVEPKNDPNLKIEWFLNGQQIEQSSRFKSSYDFGLVTLDLNDCYDRDQGIYTCRASNKAGEAFCTATVVITTKDNLIESTQHPAGEAGLEAIWRLEENLRSSDRMLPDEEGHAPVFTTPFKSLSNIEENEVAHSEAMLTPVGDQTMRVEWFYNGEALKASHRVRTVYAFGMVVLEVLGTKVADSGEYTCRASNKWGTAECSLTLEIVDRAHGQPPKFTTHIKSVSGLKDGDSAHFECTLVPIGDPNMKVEWFHNGEPLRNATRIKTVCDFGFVVLDIAYVQNHDSGEWVCKASNKYGEDFTKATLNCTGKGGVYSDSLQPGSLSKIAQLESHKQAGGSAKSPAAAEPPKFITPIANIDRLAEGQSAHFEARLTPVGDPNLTVEWFKDGKKLPSGHRYRTFHDFGIVILDILYCYEEDSGVYEARAVNKLGADKTTATLQCSSKASLILTPQVPKGMEGGLQKIQNIEDSAWMRRDSIMSERGGMAPKFTVPLSNIDNLKEGENAHFEARLVPTDDPRLKVEWYWNGKPMKFSSRIRQFCDFGFVIMELSPVYPEDSGEYMCRAYNDYGEAVTKANLKCEGKRSIILDSQLPKSMQRGMEKIAELEGLMIKSPDMPAPDMGQPPQFISNPHDVTIVENQLAHFECRLLPVGDPDLKVEWFHNGRGLAAGSRIKTITDFGYVILEIANCYNRDGGSYVCRAVNKFGEASVECKMNVTSRSGIILDPQATGRFKNCTDSIQKLEENRWKKEDIVFDEEKPCPPKFVTNLEHITDLVEGQPAHFDCRVEPVGDPSMRIEWFHNGVALAAGSRVHMMDDFGFVVLDLEWTFSRDAGEYVCRASNRWGQCTTTANMVVKSKHGVDLSTQLPQGMTAEKLKELEKGPLTEKFEEDTELTPPKFTMLIRSMNLEEGDRAFFEARVEPRADPNLRIEWYHNNKPLQSGHRFRTSFEMGHVTLELLHTYAEDSGEYLCRAVNKLGQDITRATLKSKAAQSVVIQSQVPKGMKKMDFATQMEETLSKYTKDIMLTQEDIYDIDKCQPPRFVTHIKDQIDVKELTEAKFECQLAPVGDPNMKVEWFFNGRPLPYKNRFTPIYDFGYVALIMNWVFAEDSGEYLCRASNRYGMDETKAIIKSSGRSGVVYDSQIPKGMASLEKIRELEASWQVAPDTTIEEEKVRNKPEILKKPESLIVQEGDWARFSIRVSGHPKPRVMWMVNGSTAMSGNRFKIWYDGMFHLDIPKTRQYDNGKVEVICRNSLGEAYGTCELEVKPRQDDYRAVLKNSPKQHTEGTSKSYRKPDWVVRMEQLKEQMQAENIPPQFTQEILSGRVKEMDNYTFTAAFAGNPKPDVSWYHNDKVLHNSQSLQMRVRGDKAMLTIVEAMPAHKGTYSCRVINSLGEVYTKARLEIIELSYEEKMKNEHERYAAVQIQQAAELMKQKERERSEKEKQRHDDAMKAMKDKDHVAAGTPKDKEQPKEQNMWKQQPQKKTKTTAVEEVKVVETETKEIIEYKNPKDRRISQLYSNWLKPLQLEESYPELQPDEFAPNQIPGVKCFVKVSETSVKGEEVVREIAPQFFEDQKIIEELASVHTLLKNNVKINDIWSMFRAGEFKHLQQPSIQTSLVKICEFIGHQRNVSIVLAQETQEQATRHPVGLKAFLRMLKHAKDVKADLLFKEVIPREMGKWSSTTQELEKVNQMIKQGIENEEIIATCEAGKLPTLKKPETQQPLINIVEKQGHSVMVAQVLVEEAYRDAKDELPRADQAVLISEKSLQIAAASEVVISGVELVAPPVNIKQGDQVRAVATYVAEEEHEHAMHLVEGERVYVQDFKNTDWWFVEKHLTKERGYVPAKLLAEETVYSTYVQKKLEEKIYKLPVFDKLKKGQKPEPPKIITKLEPKIVLDGQEAQFICKVEGVPRPNITWFRQTAIIKPSEEFQTFYAEDNTATLVIKEVFPEDAGMFTCVAKNQAGVAACGAELVVEGPISDHGSDSLIASRRSLSRESSVCDILEGIPPTFAQKAPEVPSFEKTFSDTSVEEDGTIRLVARVRGVPTPDVTWSSTFKRGLESCVVEETSEVILECRTSREKKCKWYKGKTELKSTDKLLIEQEGLTHRLIIHSSLMVDSGKYKCVFDNVSTQCNLTVKGIEEFVDKIQDEEVLEKEQAVFHVTVNNPGSIVTWHRDGEEITERNPRFELISEGTVRKLVLKAATLSDEGEYTCVLGDLECTAELSVRELPAEIVGKMGDQTVNKGSKATFEVELTKGDAAVTFYKNDAELQLSDHYQLSIDGKIQRLLVYNCQTEDAGVYKARVGKSEQSASLKVNIPEEGKFVKNLPGSMDVNINSTAEFYVEVNKADYQVTWYRGSERVSQTEKYVIKSEGCSRTLVVKNVSKDDSVQYTCSLGAQKTSCQLNVVELKSAPVIEKDTIKEAYVVNEGHEVTFTVPFKGSPRPKAQWFFNGQPIDASSGRFRSEVDETCAWLRIGQVEGACCGDYSVKLSNDCGDVTADFTLKILNKPSQPGKPEALTVTNDSVTLHWKVPADNGGRDISNYIIDYRIKTSETWVTYKTSENIKETTVIVTSLTTEEEYCFRVAAVNELGQSAFSDTSDFYKVSEPSKPDPPVVKEPLKPVVTGLHQKVVLKCVITGNPEPTVTWLKDEVVNMANTEYKNFSASFTIKETSGSSVGNYTCRATNEAGMAETSATVVVQEAPKFEFDGKLQCQRLLVGEKFVVPIKVTGFPQPSISWDVNGKPIESSTRVSTVIEEQQGFTSLTINEVVVDDSSVFTLNSQNSAGKATLSLNLRVIEQEVVQEQVEVVEKQAGVPEPPMGPLQASEITRSSVRLTWKPTPSDGGMAITGYYIEKMEKGQQQWHKVDEVGPTVNTYVVQNLNEGREYFFRVFAVNPIGLSKSLDVSETVVIKSPFDTPGPPSGPFDISNVTDSSATLQWNKPQSDGGSPITGYVIERREASKKAWQKIGQVEANRTQMEVTGMKRGIPYYFRVSALNEVGQGSPLQPDEPMTAGKKLTTPSKPTSLQVVDVTSKTVTIGWAPPATTGGADLIGYVIERRLTSTSKWEKVETVDASVTLFCVENLLEKSEYEFRVYAENPVGLSEEAAITERVQLKKHATPPSPPTAPLEARPTGPNSLMIEWGMPESDGGAPLIGYIIAIRDIKRTMWIEVGTVDANFTRLHIKELQEEHEYHVRVFARNEVGASDPLETDEPVKIIRPDDYQEMPEDDAAPSLSYSTTETLSWMREAGVDADIYTYARGRLLNRDEYFFKVWHQTQKSFHE